MDPTLWTQLHALTSPYASWIYALGLGLGLVVALRDAWRRGWALPASLGLAQGVVLLGILGARFLSQWPEFVVELGPQPYAWQDLPRATFLGLVLGGLGGAVLARRWLGLRHGGLDAFAFALPVTVVGLRLGCLLAGCCFGVPTDGPFGVTYGAGTLPHTVHHTLGWIAPHAAHALPVHPTQLYEAGFALILLGALRWARGRLRARGSLLLVSAAAYLGFRVGLGFLRQGGVIVAGLSVYQWVSLVGCLTLAAAAAAQELRARRGSSPDDDRLGQPPLGRHVSWLGVGLAALVLTRTWLGPLTHDILLLCVAANAAGLATRLFDAAGERRWGLAALPMAAVLLVGFTAPGERERKPQHAFTFSGATGRYQTICGGVQPYTGFGLGYDFVDSSSATAYTAGVRLWGVGGSGGQPTLGIAPNVGARGRWVGGTVGAFAFGRLGRSDWEVLPMGRLRVGALDSLFLEVSIADHYPMPFPGTLAKLGVGFSPASDTTLRVGVSESGVFIHPDITLPNGVAIVPYFSLGSDGVFQAGGSIRLSLE